MSKISIGTWNVNSIRARFEQVESVLRDNPIDILLLQETKTQDKDFPEFFFKDLKYNFVYRGQKSYNGVAIVSKFPIDVSINSLPSYSVDSDDLEARYVEAGININKKYLTVASVYVPMGGSTEDVKLEKSKRFIYKLSFFDRLISHLKTFDLENDFILFGGDFNVANEEIDLFNPKANINKVGFHDEERIRLKKFISTGGFLDLYRKINGNKIEYTWWDYRTKAFDRDLGWRIDYLFGSNKIVQNLIDCRILKYARGMEKASDHTIVLAEINIE